MENGRFTKEERDYLLSLEAVDEVRAKSIVYSKRFKEECMRRYRAGEKSGAIFASAGLPSSLIGYKRIERAVYHWKEAEAKGALTATDAPQKRHRDRDDTIRREKRGAVARQRAIRERQVAELEEKLARQRARARTREEKLIARQAAEIAALKAQAQEPIPQDRGGRPSQGRAPTPWTGTSAGASRCGLASVVVHGNSALSVPTLECVDRGYFLALCHSLFEVLLRNPSLPFNIQT